jgi:hypothetical protein
MVGSSRGMTSGTIARVQAMDAVAGRRRGYEPGRTTDPCTLSKAWCQSARLRHDRAFPNAKVLVQLSPEGMLP